MDDGELDFTNQFLNMDNDQFIMSNDGYSMDTLFDEMLKDISSTTTTTSHHACSHTHTCNPPGPDLSHTHTCVHVHTKILPTAPTNDVDHTAESNTKKHSLGNREAVRKYCAKKKARVAAVEEEVVRLRSINQELVKKLEVHVALEAEVARLKCLLVDIRGRIEGEIGSTFPYKRLTNMQNSNSNLLGSYVVNPCDGFRCDDDAEGGFRACGFGNVPCNGTTYGTDSGNSFR